MRRQGLSVTEPRKAAKQRKRPPETDNEYLDYGVSLEESAEKWRFGDPKKAARFYVKALEAYDEALALFPRSFDLAYNKARVQYSITQLPSICSSFPGSLTDLLQTALGSHRHALDIDSNNADLLFNTAQVLTSLAETVDDASLATDMLQEAVSLFLRCLDLQEALLTQFQSQTQEMDVIGADDDDQGDGGVSLNVEEDQDGPQSQWATMIEPVTKASLIDTSIAMLDALSCLCTIADNFPVLTHADHHARQILQIRLPNSLSSLEDDAGKDEARCASLKYRAAFCEAEFRFGAATFTELDQRLQDIFGLEPSNGIEDPRRSSPYLVCFADALISFAIVGAEVANAGVLRYNRVTKALDCLAEAARFPEVKDKASIHMCRGDAELLRFSLCAHSTVTSNLSTESTRITLLKNAATFYRGAAATAKATTGIRNEITETATIKETVTHCILSGTSTPMKHLASSGVGETVIRKVISDIIEESLVQETTLQNCSLL